ncbi:hypothetical protein BaRGS_00035072 [Batillaria attramentaria]|uniref:Uncharacterized protein n=1 Tax=Batillaria attramentaria TaxID=370345 RepID=A0ABD0JFH9_9CAEN
MHGGQEALVPSSQATCICRTGLVAKRCQWHCKQTRHLYTGGPGLFDLGQRTLQAFYALKPSQEPSNAVSNQTWPRTLSATLQPIESGLTKISERLNKEKACSVKQRNAITNANILMRPQKEVKARQVTLCVPSFRV